MKNMTNVTVSLTKEEYKLFKALYKKETRGPSDQFRHMMKEYTKKYFPDLLKILETKQK